MVVMMLQGGREGGSCFYCGTCRREGSLQKTREIGVSQRVGVAGGGVDVGGEVRLGCLLVGQLASECCGPGGFESECQLGPTDTHSHLLSKSVDREEGPCNNDHSQLALEPFGLVTVRRSHQSLVDSATTANTFDRTPVHAIKMVGKKSGRALFKEEGTINSSSLPLQLVAHS